MKYLKTFEELNIGNPKVGDYVLMKSKNHPNSIASFIDNSIGQLKKIDSYKGINRGGVYYGNDDEVTTYGYTVEYENIPYKIKYFFTESTRIFDDTQLVGFSKNKEDIEVLLNAKKYNL